MDQQDKIRRIFLFGTVAMGVLIVGGLVWAVAMGPGEGGNTIDPNITFNDDLNPAVGPENAKVTVRIFSDFQCSACKIAEVALRQAESQYKDRVRFVWNDYPLTSLHANAMGAAVAARCAQEQNKFWEYSEKLFANQAVWEKLADPNPQFTALAKDLGLLDDKFALCLGKEQPKNKVKQDIAEGEGMGIEGTPTFFINRQRFSGAWDLVAWQKALDQALK